MSFSKAKLKRFNDVDMACASPLAASKATGSQHNSATELSAGTATNAAASAATPTTITTDRREQIEKFFKDAVRFASHSKADKEFVIPKEGGLKEDKKSKGLRLFRTPSLPHRLRFRGQSHETASAAAAAAAAAAVTTSSSTTSSTPLQSATTTPVKLTGRLKGKEALQHEIRVKNELITGYMSQIDVLRRHVDQLKETESKLRDESTNMNAKMEQLVEALTAENSSHKQLNDQLSAEKTELHDRCGTLELELQKLREQHTLEVAALQSLTEDLKKSHGRLEAEYTQQCSRQAELSEQIARLVEEAAKARDQLAAGEEQTFKTFEQLENVKNTNEALRGEITQLQRQIEQDALSYAHEAKVSQTEMDCLRQERNTLKNDLAAKCEFIRSLQDELLDKNCEIDAHCDTIRQFCREKAAYAAKEQQMDENAEKVRRAESEAEQKVQRLETELETALEREKAYWRSELERRQKIAENEVIKVELEKQDVMVLLESTNDMLRDRDDKLQRYEEQLRNGIDYYVQLTDTLQKQVVDLKQEVAKIISEKYNYQLTLSNTRSTVNILMERLKKSDSDVEQFRAELESTQLAKGALEHTYLTLQRETEMLRGQLTETDEALQALRNSTAQLQLEERIDEAIATTGTGAGSATTATETALADGRAAAAADAGAAERYLELYSDLKCKDDRRELYMQDMKRALDEFATVLQFAQLELDSKEKMLAQVRDECEHLKLENLALRTKVEETTTTLSTYKKENITDLEKIEDLLIDSELRAECDKITSWLLNTSATEKCSVRGDSTHEITELLKGAPTATPVGTAPNTPQSKAARSSSCSTPPVRSSPVAKVASAQRTTPKTPHTPRTPRTTPKKSAVVLFPGKENLPSPQKQVLKARNI